MLAQKKNTRSNCLTRFLTPSSSLAIFRSSCTVRAELNVCVGLVFLFFLAMLAWNDYCSVESQWKTDLVNDTKYREEKSIQNGMKTHRRKNGSILEKCNKSNTLKSCSQLILSIYRFDPLEIVSSLSFTAYYNKWMTLIHLDSSIESFSCVHTCVSVW